MEPIDEMASSLSSLLSLNIKSDSTCTCVPSAGKLPTMILNINLYSFSLGLYIMASKIIMPSMQAMKHEFAEKAYII